MDDAREVAEKLKGYFKKKYPELEVKTISFKEIIDLESSKRFYEIDYTFERKGRWLGSELPNYYRSKISFEKAFDKSKLMIEAYFKSEEVNEN